MAGLPTLPWCTSVEARTLELATKEKLRNVQKQFYTFRCSAHIPLVAERPHQEVLDHGRLRERSTLLQHLQWRAGDEEEGYFLDRFP